MIDVSTPSDIFLSWAGITKKQQQTNEQKSKQRGGEYSTKFNLTTSRHLLTLTYIGWYAIALDYDVFIEKASILPCDWVHPAVKNPGNSWKAYIAVFQYNNFRECDFSMMIRGKLGKASTMLPDTKLSCCKRYSIPWRKSIGTS